MSTVTSRVLIVDDHPIVREGVRQTLARVPDFDVCCEAPTAAAAVEACARLEPDIAIVDLSLGDLHGLELVKRLAARHPALKILVLSMHDELLFARRSLRAGARGYITKDEAIEGLVEALRTIRSGRLYVSERVSQQLLTEVGRGGAADASLAELSNRELQVLELIGHGRSMVQIAEALGVSGKTIETYRANIRSKLKLEDGGSLVRFAVTWVLDPSHMG